MNKSNQLIPKESCLRFEGWSGVVDRGEVAGQHEKMVVDEMDLMGAGG